LLALEKPTAAPNLVSPGGDPADDSTLISYTLTAPATVAAAFVDANGQVLSPLFSEAKAAGAQSFTFTPAAGVPFGQYSVQLTATTTTGRTASAAVPFAIDDTLAAFAPSAAAFSSSKPGGVSLMFTLTRPVTAELQVLRGATVVATPLGGPLAAGLQTLTWDGTVADGATAPDGTYVLSLAVTDPFTTFTKTATVTVDSTAPAIKVLSYRLMRFRVSEPAVLTLVVGARRYTRALKQPKTVSFWLAEKPRAYRLIAADAAGNTSVVRYRSR
jgi:flagellar hook assembly protein FlgD